MSLIGGIYLTSSCSIQIKTLTPLWTGDANGNCETVKETGILGSLRWWYEAIVRGLGGYACDPTSEGKCELNYGKFNETLNKGKSIQEALDEQICPACQLFGCTGWKKRFRLEVTNKGFMPFQLATLSKKGKTNYHWLSQVFEKSINSNLPYGEVELIFKQLKNDEVRKQIEALISIMAHMGAIGARTQYGFGQFDWENKMGLKEALIIIQEFIDDNKFKQDKKYSKLNSLDNFWFYNLTLPLQNRMIKKFQKANFIGKYNSNKFILPVSFDIRYKIPEPNINGLREYYSHKHGKKETSNIFGTNTPKKLGSKVFVSHIFRKNINEDYNLNVWGFTEDSIGKEVGEGLKELFGVEKMSPILIGREICKEVKNDI